ncbi:MAG TPA: hypothetical protein VGK00_04835 [Anaerolineales bacterium]
MKKPDARDCISQKTPRFSRTEKFEKNGGFFVVENLFSKTWLRVTAGMSLSIKIGNICSNFGKPVSLGETFSTDQPKVKDGGEERKMQA